MTGARDTLQALAQALGLDTQRLLHTHACAFTLKGDVHLELQWREAEDALWLAARIGYARPEQGHALAMSALVSSTALAQASGTSLAYATDRQAMYLCRPVLLRDQTPEAALAALHALVADGQAVRQTWVDAQLLVD